MLLTTSSPQATIALGAALAALLEPGDLIFLEGQLGAGKTRLVKGIAQGLGLDGESISSPTFVIAHEHSLPPSPSPSAPQMLVHIDAYRVNSLEDLESIGWTRDSARPHSEFRRGVITVIEWASRMKVPTDVPRFQIDIFHLPDEQREIRINPVHIPQARIDALARHLAKIKLP
jgi:tRNA threonylcarbamoyladenosine biosynthesis protein TsaE